MKRPGLSQEIISLILLVCLLLLLGYITLHHQASLDALQARLQLEQQAFEHDQNQLHRLIELRDEEPLLLEKLLFVGNLIPEEETVQELMRYLQTTASASGVKLIQLHFGQEESAGEYLELPVTISLECSFHDLLRLLGNLRAGERAVKIDSIRLGSDENKEQRLHGELKVRAFRRR